MNFLDGEIRDKTHLYSLRVQYEDTDIGGIVYHAKYLNFIERARSALIRKLEFPAEKLLKKNLSIVVKKLYCEWQNSCTLGDTICVKTHLIEFKKASLVLSQVIFNEHDKKQLSNTEVTLCFLNKNMKVTRMPENFLKSLKSILPN